MRAVIVTEAAEVDADTVLDPDCQALQLSLSMDDGRANEQTDDDALVRWLSQLAVEDREKYRRIRDLAWRLVAENVDRSFVPN
jgi:hypothetical protein